MSQPAHYQQVIQRVIERNSGKGMTPGELAEAIVEGLDLAEAILGDSPTAPVKSNVRIQTLTPEIRYREINIDAAILIGEEAPPVAVVRNPTAVRLNDTLDEVESKKAVLVSQIVEKLPASVTVDLPEVGKLVLNRYIKPMPVGVEMVRVIFAQVPDDEDGPQAQLWTGQPGFDADLIVKTIQEAALMRYRKAKPVITPRIPPTQGMPDVDNMTLRPTAADLAPTSEDDLAAWRKHTGSNRI